MSLHQVPLKFPREVRRSSRDGLPISEEYIIPLNAKKRVLEIMYPFEGVPQMNETLYDLHAGKKFAVMDFKVVRENGADLLVSPFYYESGGTVIDWMPTGFEASEEGAEDA